MQEKQKMEDKLVKIKFDGQTHQVNAQVFISTLVNFSEVVKEINRELGSHKSIEIKIVATAEGSFDAHLVLQAVDGAQQLLTRDNVDLLSGVVTVIGGVYGLRKWLSTRTVQDVSPQGDSVKVTDVNGDSIIIKGDVYNIYNNNQIVNDAVSNSFASLQDDPSITALEISDESNVLFRAEQDEFDELATKVVIEDENNKKITTAASLTINKVVFEGPSRKWEFIYQGNRIAANISDEDFYKQIDEGESFAKGDQLQVNLEITQAYDESLKAYLNKSYTVVKVSKHIPRDKPEQLNIINDY
jgi:hypothetical protein